MGTQPEGRTRTGADPVHEAVATQPADVAAARRRRPWARRALLAALALVLLAVIAACAWVVLGYRAFADEMGDANARVDPALRAVLPPAGDPLDRPQTTLVVVGDQPGGPGAGGVMLVRTDPDAHRLSTLSLTLDTRIPDASGAERSARRIARDGGPAALVDALTRSLGTGVDHILLLRPAALQQLVDSLGGLTVRNPRVSVSRGRYAARFPRGRLRLDGVESVGYASVVGDAALGNQERLLDAVTRALGEPSTLFHLPSVGRDLAGTVTTDLTAGELVRLGWIRARADGGVACRIGDEGSLDGSGVRDAWRSGALTGARAACSPAQLSATAPLDPGTAVRALVLLLAFALAVAVALGARRVLAARGETVVRRPARPARRHRTPIDVIEAVGDRWAGLGSWIRRPRRPGHGLTDRLEDVSDRWTAAVAHRPGAGGRTTGWLERVSASLESGISRRALLVAGAGVAAAVALAAIVLLAA